MAIEHLTILHSNDMHGAFLPQDVDGCLTGGVALMSGYINAQRAQDENTIYLFAGDMFQGSLLDRDYHGASTCKIMEMIQPDAMTLGNHEVDHGLDNLQTLYELHSLPIVTTNLRVKSSGEALFTDHLVIVRGNIKILVLGLTTEKIMLRSEKEPYFEEYVDFRDPCESLLQTWSACMQEAEDEGTAYDLVILLSHLGIEMDRKLANLPELQGKINLIIGGHDHECHNEDIGKIRIVQLKEGTNHLGRLELDLDTDQHVLTRKPEWTLIEINEDTCEPNQELQALVWDYKDIVDNKYSEVLTRIGQQVGHDGFRYQETKIGNLIADALRDKLHVKIAMVGSGSLRQNKIGDVITLYNLREMYSFDEPYFQITMRGDQLRRVFQKIFRESPESGENSTEYYQVSEKCHFVYSKKEDKFIAFEYDDREIQDDQMFDIGIEKFLFDHLEKFWGISIQEVLDNGPKMKLSKDVFTSLAAYFRAHPEIETPRIQNRTKNKRGDVR